MIRATQKDLDRMQRLLNSMLSKTPWRIEVARRYNYFAIDLIRKDTGIERTLATGLTKSQALDYLFAMLYAIDLVSG